ncbi:signal peptidase I [Dehalobacterium formicoaceticum]|uniref:Signal peptidase I n=1 Tax=Dehalobacterium formicoaceticum TaxID=51515 RepID=A0ABT1Y8U5_9FIRM|nr:signal peptidase I [Dehalobacterium formicoaceticum]MCR6546324.1 signal peptidase I [Dehalobacterium formicoaceticum]
MGRAKKVIWEIVSTIIIAGLITLIVKFFLFDNRIIPTSSMYPTIFAGDMVLVNKLVYRFGDPERKDIIVFEAPPEPEISGDDMIKRVIGLPGEKVEIKEGTVYINDLPLTELYQNEAPQYQFGPQQVPEDYLFVLGDNRNMSFDSHLWSDPFLSMDSVKGKAFFRYWPLKRMGRLESEED